MRNRFCPSCGGGDLENRFHGSPEVLECRSCRLAFLAEFPSPAERAAYYQDEYYEEGTGQRFLRPFERLVRAFRNRRARDILKRLPAAAEGRGQNTGRNTGRNAGRNAFLDIGCGRGLLLEAFERRGWEAVGTQLSRTAPAACRGGSGVRILNGELPELRLDEESFRAIAIYHVLEHVDRPAEYLAETRRLLRPDGLLVVEVPDAGGPGFRFLGLRNFCLDHPNHLLFFRPGTLRRMLEAAGFEIAAESRFSLEYSPFTTLQNLLNLLPGAENRLYRSLMRNAEGRRLRREPLTWLHALLGALLAGPAFFLSLAGLFFPVGNTLRFYCWTSPVRKAQPIHAERVEAV